MPRREQDGRVKAAQAGAEASLPAVAGVPSALTQARTLDRAYFQRNPQAQSYTRPYIEGECLWLSKDDARPLFVAVAFLSAGMSLKVGAYARCELASAKREAEALAAQWRDGAARGVSA